MLTPFLSPAKPNIRSQKGLVIIFYYTHLEDYIFDLLNGLGITKPNQLDMHDIAKRLGIKVSYKRKHFTLDNEIILARGTKIEEWVSFAHELKHTLLDCGNQLLMHPLFKELQEWKADYFAYHFCIPTFMLDELPLSNVDDIVRTFNVDYEFAYRRYEMYQNKQMTRKKLQFV